MNKEKYWVNLISLLGAGILGFGLGVYFSETFRDYSIWLIVIGAITHGLAMWKNYQR